MNINIRRGCSADWSALVDFNCQMAQETEKVQLDVEKVTAGVQALLADSDMGFYVIAEASSQDTGSKELESNEPESEELRSEHAGSEEDAPNNTGREIAGSLMITTEWSDWRNGVFWWVQSVYIQPEFRRKGIYRQLYEHIKELANEADNVCGFRLYVEKENQVAQKTYKTLGMEETHYLMYEEGMG